MRYAWICRFFLVACLGLIGNPAAWADIQPADVANAYYKSIIAEVQPLHPKALLLNTDPDAALEKFQRNSIGGRAAFSDVPVTGQLFHQAIRVDTDKKPQEWMTHLQSFTPAIIAKGDVLYVTAYVRAVAVQDGKDVGQGKLYASTERGGNQNHSSGLGAADFAIPRIWTRIHFPLSADREGQDGDQLKLMFTFGQTAQVVEIGGIAVIDFGPGVDKAALPHAALPLDYPGRASNAAWRKAAQARIEKYRKGDLTVKVVARRESRSPVRRFPSRKPMRRSCGGRPRRWECCPASTSSRGTPISSAQRAPRTPTKRSFRKRSYACSMRLRRVSPG